MSPEQETPDRAWGELRDSEVRPILAAYDEPMLDRVYDMLARIVDADDRWNTTLDGKANLVLGFSVALLTVTLTWIGPRIGGWAVFTMMLPGVLCLFAALVFAFAGLRARDWPVWADSALLPVAAGSHDDRAEAKRYWAQALYAHRKRAQTVLRAKARVLMRAQTALMGGAILVCLAAAGALLLQYSPYRTAFLPAVCQASSAAVVAAVPALAVDSAHPYPWSPPSPCRGSTPDC